MGRNISDIPRAEREQLWRSFTEHMIGWLDANNVAGSGAGYSLYVLIQDAFLKIDRQPVAGPPQLQPGDVVQLDDSDPVFRGCLLVLSKVGRGFVQGFAIVPARPNASIAPYRCAVDRVTRIGRAEFTFDQE